ncbi:MAG: Gfo/Idh/MocA family oxidoreductase [Candidatus Bathyarchaeota archaeon]|jgi:myo-inositol 2-dehydrogenase/D-chiro-inositol 1-dehydrogenase|nr:Gfo/Idh/MocA family oxidoreductase [Candidatus Bathyarchaeota archaeon A05DMB-5]MDH7557854.1 Gfo/Idh/MocA family oxidoreductase [Candidatus Bathyarchaeota archaeon]
MIKVGIVGLGKMGMLHFKNCRFINDIKVVAACDVSKSRLQKAREMGIKNVYSDYKGMLKSADVDALIIALPNFMHLESICAAAEAGKDIFVEKPLAPSVGECEEIAKVVEKHCVKLMVGHNYRFFDSVEKVKNEFERGVVGDVELATLELALNGPFAPAIEPTPVPEWYFTKEGIGMGCLDSGYHLIDLFQWFFGEAEILYAHLGYRYHLPYEDSAIIVLRSRNESAKGVLNVGWFSKAIFPKFDFRMILHGTAGFMSTDQYAPKNLYVHAAKEGMKNILRRLFGRTIRPLTYTYYYASYAKELRHFFNCIKTDSEPLVTVDEARKNVEVIERIYQEYGKVIPYETAEKLHKIYTH